MAIRVWCIEDDPSAELIRHHLEEAGCTIETIYDGESGLAELYVRPLDVVKAFTYAIAHDLKQPLTVLQSSLDLLERYIQNGDEAKINRKMSGMQQIVGKMNATLNGLVELARLREAEDVPIECIDMDQIVVDVLQNLSDTFADTGATIKLKSGLPPALGFRPWIESVWANYIINAVKYGGSPPLIEIGAIRNDDGTNHDWVKATVWGWPSCARSSGASAARPW